MSYSRKYTEQSEKEQQGETDEETVRAIEEGEAQLERGEGRPWEEVREELRAKHLGQ